MSEITKSFFESLCQHSLTLLSFFCLIILQLELFCVTAWYHLNLGLISLSFWNSIMLRLSKLLSCKSKCTSTYFNLLRVSIQNWMNCVCRWTQDWHKVGRRVLTKTLAPRRSLRCCYCCILDSLITSVPANYTERVKKPRISENILSDINKTIRRGNICNYLYVKSVQLKTKLR